MRQYEMTLVAISEKRVKISAESAEAAAQMVEKIYSETNLLDFSNRDVTDVSVLAKAADTIEGNSGDICARRSYSMGSDSIYGYGAVAY